MKRWFFHKKNLSVVFAAVIVGSILVSGIASVCANFAADMFACGMGSMSGKNSAVSVESCVEDADVRFFFENSPAVNCW